MDAMVEQMLESYRREHDRLEELFQQQARDLEARDREVEVLTVERDNALLRIEELEAQSSEFEAIANRHLLRIEELESELRTEQDYRRWMGSGVNPNA